jgi:peptide/nickel transport system permease protein
VTPTWRRLARHGGARFGAVVVLAFAVVAVLAPWVAPYDPEAIALGTNLLGPSWSHPFGTDSLGRDVLSRTIWGARISLTIGLVSVGLAMVGGVPLGALAAWTGGWTDRRSCAPSTCWCRFRRCCWRSW